MIHFYNVVLYGADSKDPEKDIFSKGFQSFDRNPGSSDGHVDRGRWCTFRSFLTETGAFSIVVLLLLVWVLISLSYKKVLVCT